MANRAFYRLNFQLGALILLVSYTGIALLVGCTESVSDTKDNLGLPTELPDTPSVNPITIVEDLIVDSDDTPGDDGNGSDPTGEGDGNDSQNKLYISTHELNFGSLFSIRDLILANQSDERAYYQITWSDPWLNISPTFGDLARTESHRILVTVSRDGLSTGDYSSIINLLTNQGEEIITVKFTVGDPEDGDGSRDPNSVGDPNAPADPAARLRFLPCIEDNYSWFDAQVRTGLSIWSEVAEDAVVITMPGRSGLFQDLRQRVPEINVIPGLKTYSYFLRPDNSLKPFDTIEAWSQIADEIVAICSASGQLRVMLENEVPIAPVWQDLDHEIDYDQLAIGLSQLPSEVEIIWYPSLPGESNESRARMVRVCNVVESTIGDVTFIDLSASTPQALLYDWYSLVPRNMLWQIADRQTSPIMYFYGPDSEWWQDDDIPDAAEYIYQHWGVGTEVMIYPGLDHWIDGARSMVDHLKAAGW